VQDVRALLLWGRLFGLTALLLPVVAVRDTSPRQRQGIAEMLSNDSGVSIAIRAVPLRREEDIARALRQVR
jgi:hypothetical protein